MRKVVETQPTSSARAADIARAKTIPAIAQAFESLIPSSWAYPWLSRTRPADGNSGRASGCHGLTDQIAQDRGFGRHAEHGDHAGFRPLAQSGGDGLSQEDGGDSKPAGLERLGELET